MKYEQIQAFLISPNLPDIITYVLYCLTLISTLFLKKFVKKDNSKVLYTFDNKSKELSTSIKELNHCKKALENEREQFQKEKQYLLNEINSLKESIKIIAGNTKELVSNGTAKEIADKMTTNYENKEGKRNE